MKPDADHDLMLYSIAEFFPLLQPLLEALPANGLCEVGVEAGRFTRAFGGYCRAKHLPYIGIDPSLDDGFVNHHTTSEMSFMLEESLKALPRVASDFNVFVLDGDHNYYTVYHELQAIYGGGRRDAISILHDVEWPWSRRDQYCEPERIPEDFLHPHRDDQGVVMGTSALVENEGFIGRESNYPYHTALHEGGEKNGVWTAVEQFIRQKPEFNVTKIPVIFGVAIVWSPAHVPPDFRARLSVLTEALQLLEPLLRKLEDNRIALLLDHIGMHRKWTCFHKQYSELKKEYDDILGKFTTLLKQWDDLYAKYLELETRERKG